MTEPVKDSPEWRKQRPLYTGVLKYFPDALLEVAHVSWVGNEQHNPGTPLHWDRSKSQDEGDAAARHLVAAGTRDSDGTRHTAKAAWRTLALLQKEIEAEQQAEVTAADDLDSLYERDERKRCNNCSPDAWTCTRTREHKGRHIAHWLNGRVCQDDETNEPIVWD